MSIALVWFRQDLRLADNPAFITACNSHDIVVPLYIFDKTTSVLGQAQQWWLHHSLEALRQSLEKYDLPLILRQGNPLKIFIELSKEISIDTIYWNRCYEPAAIARDKKIKLALQENGLKVVSSNGSLLNEPWEIKNKSGDYFKVFTPYWKCCVEKIMLPPILVLDKPPQSLVLKSDSIFDWNLLPQKPNWAAQFSDYWQPGEAGALNKLEVFIEDQLNDYKIDRDFPKENATSKLSPHLHFGEISPWAIWRVLEFSKLEKSNNLASTECFMSELGWREFSYYLLYHFPSLPHHNVKKEFDAFPWENNKKFLKCWQTGMTGYPIVDAGMRELWATGYMHNRVRMIVASFLTKHLLIDWRKGAAWFLDTLLDADLASNSMSWQWVAGCGVDAAPYFRIFNPILQSQKFDPDGIYIRQWIPELANVSACYIHQPWLAPASEFQCGKHYPVPIVDHNDARKKALEYYKIIKNFVAE